MSTHQGLDLSKFKKISSDGKTTTLRHRNGHEIKIAHVGLNDKMREHINSMPAYLAEGEEVPGQIENQDQDALQDENQDAKDAAEMAATQIPQPDGQQQNAMPQQQPQDVSNPLVGVSPSQVAQEVHPHTSGDAKMQELMNKARDMAMGDVSPKTYSDLYADKGTLGKIGTIFGLIVGGAGSGLTGQPNALLSMMTKQIDQDFEKQKVNRENARNFLSLQYQHNVQRAQIADHMQSILNKRLQGTKEAAALKQYFDSMGIKDGDEFLKNYNQKSEELWVDPEAIATGHYAAADHIEKIADKTKNPNIIATGKQVADGLRAKGNQVIADAGPRIHKEAAASATQPSSIDRNKFFKATTSGAFTPSGFAPAKSTINPSDKNTVLSEVSALDNNRNGYKSWSDSFHKILGMPLAGQAPGAFVANEIGKYIKGAGPAAAGLAEQFERDREVQLEYMMEHFDMDRSKANSLLPSWKDLRDPKKIAEVYRKGEMYFKNRETKLSPVLDQYASQIPGLKVPFEKQQIELRFPEMPKKENIAKGKSSGEVNEKSAESPPQDSGGGFMSGLKAIGNALGIEYKPPK